MFPCIRFVPATLFIALLALTMHFAAPPAHAQCTSHIVYNYTGCGVKLALLDAWDNVVSYEIPPVVGPTTLNGPGTDFIDAIGVIDANDKPQPFVGLPAPGCTPCISLQATAGGTCCATVCYNSATCTFTITPCGPC